MSGCQSCCCAHCGTSCGDPPRFAATKVGSVNAPRSTDRDALALPLMQRRYAAASRATDIRSWAASQQDARRAHCSLRASLCMTREHARDRRALRLVFESSALHRRNMHLLRSAGLSAAFLQLWPSVHCTRDQCNMTRQDAGAGCLPRPVSCEATASGRRRHLLLTEPRSQPGCQPAAATIVTVMAPYTAL